MGWRGGDGVLGGGSQAKLATVRSVLWGQELRGAQGREVLRLQWKGSLQGGCGCYSWLVE